MKKKNKDKGIIYKVECRITGEVYIGATTDSVEQRKLDHQERANRGENTKLANAIATYGPEAFFWETIDTADNVSDLAGLEKIYILKYNSQRKGYNASSGGEMKKTVYQYEMESGKLLKVFDSLEQASTEVGASKNCISAACLKENKSCRGFYWSYNYFRTFTLRDQRKKQVVQISLKTGQPIAQFSSVSEASKVSGVYKSSIAKVCRCERKQAGGYGWRYI